MNNRIILGVGQTGTKLADLYAQKTGLDCITFNTDSRDARRSLTNNYTIKQGGASSNFSKGKQIWLENSEKLERILKDVHDKIIIYFISSGGGSGSSSYHEFSKILLNQNNKILLIISTPLIKEGIPATSNTTRLLSDISEFKNNISIFVADTNHYSKDLTHFSFHEINKKIINNTDLLLNIANRHKPISWTPCSVDEGDHNSVVFSSGFINMSFTDIEDPDENYPKFSYGKIKESNNILIVKKVGLQYGRDYVQNEFNKLVNASTRLNVRGSRLLYGIIRNDSYTMKRYTTIASGLSIDKIFNKFSKSAKKSAIIYHDKLKPSHNKILKSSETKILDI